MTKVILFLENCNPDSGFHYGRKEGGDLTFIYNRERNRHEASFTIDEWRADNFRLAKTLLDQHLVYPVFFDIEESNVASCVAPTMEPAPLSATVAALEQTMEPGSVSIGSDAPPAKRAKRPKLTEEQRAAAKAAYEAEQPPPHPSFIPK